MVESIISILRGLVKRTGSHIRTGDKTIDAQLDKALRKPRPPKTSLPQAHIIPGERLGTKVDPKPPAE